MDQRQYCITIDDASVPVTKEVYYAYKRPVWAEQKRRERWSRCRKPDGSRCESACSKCPNQRTGSVLSLEKSREEGFEPQDPTSDVADIVVSKLLLEKLMHLLTELDPDSRRICELISQGASEREIATVLGVRQSTLNYRKNKLFGELREHLEKYI